MMTNEELKEAREFEHCHEYDYCNADGIIENLLDYVEEQQTQLNHRYLDLQQICDDQAKQIATLKTICIKERFWQIWKAGECQTVERATQKAKDQLAKEYPEIDWGGQL